MFEKGTSKRKKVIEEVIFENRNNYMCYYSIGGSFKVFALVLRSKHLYNSYSKCFPPVPTQKEQRRRKLLLISPQIFPLLVIIFVQYNFQIKILLWNNPIKKSIVYPKIVVLTTSNTTMDYWYTRWAKRRIGGV